MMMKNFKKFMKRRGDKKPVHQRKYYECGEKGHYIADCPHKKNDKEDNKSKDKYDDKRRRVRNTRRNMAMLMLVKVGSEVMTPTKKK
jgi:hypothetical protein